MEQIMPIIKHQKVPPIRFRGFSGEWEEKSLGDVAEITMGQSPSSNSYNSEKIGMPLIQGNADIQNRLSNPRNWTTEKTKECKIGDLILTVRAPVGTIAKSLHEACIGRGVCAVRNNETNTNEFIYQFLLGYETQWSILEQGSTFTAVSGTEIRNLKISIPNLTEQTKIGDYFQKLDRLLEQKEKKYQKLKQFKKAMLSKMFPKNVADTPEIRFKGFSGKWEIKKFGECVLIQRGGSPRPIEKFITQNENGINWIKIGDVSTGSRYITKTKEKIIPEGEKHSRKVLIGDLILSNSMSFGRPYIMAIEGCIHDGWLLIRDEQKMFNLEYLLQLLSSDYMINQYKALASGGVVINLNSELVQSTNVYIPTITEQTKIGDYFQKLDSRIDLQLQELEKLKNIKKASLSKMFV